MKVRCPAWKECRDEHCPHRKIHTYKSINCDISCDRGVDLLSLSRVRCEEIIIKHNRNGANS